MTLAELETVVDTFSPDERATLYNYVLTLEEGALAMEDRIRERQS